MERSRNSTPGHQEGHPFVLCRVIRILTCPFVQLYPNARFEYMVVEILCSRNVAFHRHRVVIEPPKMPVRNTIDRNNDMSVEYMPFEFNPTGEHDHPLIFVSPS